MQEKLNQLEEKITRSYGNIAGIVIRKADKTVYERYFNGCTASRPVHVFSVTKSIVSILVGIAIDRGYIESVHQKVFTFFPDQTAGRRDDMFQTVTIEHLLTMTAPYKFKRPPYKKVFSSKDWVQAALEQLGGKKPAGTFRYMEMIGPDILSGILQKATGRPMLDFAQEYLFSPLEITVPSPIILYTARLHQTFIRKGDAAGGWVTDECGHQTAGWGLMLTAMDMAKIGQLYLNGGIWEGREIVSAEWVAKSLKAHSRWEKENLSYGYLWWTGIGNGYAAMGNSGNVIYVHPRKKIVVAVNALFRPAAKDVVEWIVNEIEPVYPE